jgi:arylsulfatase A-like enzyme
MDLGAAEGPFADRVIQMIPKLKSPYFLTIQLSNGHYPYLVQPDGPQPFQPATQSKAPKKNGQFFNHYQNAVHQEDAHLARILTALRAAPGGEQTVLVYTSDHGEAFREHGQMGHTFSLYDEELHVPGFIDALEGTLSATERAQLSKNARQFLVLPDLTATILDLLGAFDSPALDPYRGPMIGRSLLRPLDTDRIFPLTNCTELWTCGFENWGAMRGPIKLQAREWDADYRCFDLRNNPEETGFGLIAPACAPLREQAQVWFKRFPGEGRDSDD